MRLHCLTSYICLNEFTRYRSGKIRHSSGKTCSRLAVGISPQKSQALVGVLGVSGHFPAQRRPEWHGRLGLFLQ